MSEFLRPPEFIREFLSYDPETGLFTWLKSPTRRLPAGSQAGALTERGYRLIKFRRRTHPAARLAWFLHYGEHPDRFVDHINGNPRDNRIANLRLATIEQNMANQKGWGRLKKGVVARRRGKPFAAKIVVNKKAIIIGYYATEDEAHAAYCAAAVKHYGEFARFE